MDSLDIKLNQIFAGKVVRKDLVHKVKKVANIPSFVLEFLLSKYCATNDPDEIEQGIRAVLSVIEDNYIRPDEANKAQSLVSQKGKYKFIDKIHVRFLESEKKHWASMENFNSRKIAINDSFFEENEKLLEGGIWAEVTVGASGDEDNYAFYIEQLRPIQLARFNETIFFEGRKKFTTDEWIDVLLRSVGIEPTALNKRLKFLFLSRLIPLVQSNFNYIELGPRGTGKSFFYSEFSPYSTLFSGGQASTATLLYNNARHKVGAVGYWDNIAFDEVGKMKIKDEDTIQIMKDYMANGRFSRGTEVIANASFAFVGNIDHSINQLVSSPKHDLFITLPPAFDLAVQDRLFFYLPGWEIPKMDARYFTTNFGLITDYLAEAFHYLFKHNKEYYELVNSNIKLGKDVQGRDEIAIKKTVTALLKLIHPAGTPTEAEFNEIVEFAIEGRRRVKEQMNKRKADDEFAAIQLSYFDKEGHETIVYCPESKDLYLSTQPIENKQTSANETKSKVSEVVQNQPKEQHIKLRFGDTGYSYESLMKDYLKDAKEIVIEDPNIKQNEQILNFVRFCELVVKIGVAHRITLKTSSDDLEQWNENLLKFAKIADNLLENDIILKYQYDNNLHDSAILLSNGWTIKIERGLDYFQSLKGEYFAIGTFDMDLRPCLETSVDIFRD